MKKKTSSQSLYVIFGVVIALLVALIGYFVYLLVSPSTTASDTATPTNTNEVVVENVNADKTKKKKKTNTNATVNENANTATNDNANASTDGLVEPKPEDDTATADTTEADTAAEEVVAGEGEQVVTVYFPKAGSSCGEVFPVKRAITPEADLYGQILLADMAGPTDEETGYASAIPSGLRLRRVEYSATGPVVYVNEAWDDADDCDQQTAKAQLIETANAMFDFTAGTVGEVIVGYPEDAVEEEETTTDEETTE